MVMTESDNRRRQPDFVLHLQVSDNTTARLLVYRDDAGPLKKAGGGGGLAAAAADVRPSSWENSVAELNVSTYDVNISPVLAPPEIRRDYDAEGAMYFSIAVILIYGISIAMLVAASTLRRSHSDYELKSFLRSYSRLDVERRSREKQRIRAILQQLNWLTSPVQPPPAPPGLVAVAAAAPHAAAVAVTFRMSTGSPIVRPVMLCDARGGAGLGSTPTESTSTFISGNHRDANTGEERYQVEVDTKLSKAFDKRPVTGQAESCSGSDFTRHLSESSLLLAKCDSKVSPSAANRRNTFV